MFRPWLPAVALAGAAGLAAARAAAAPAPPVEPDLSHLALCGDEDWARLLEAIVSGARALASPPAPRSAPSRLAALELRLGQGAGPLNDLDLEALATMAGAEVLLVTDAPGRHDDLRPVGLYGPRAHGERLVWLKVPLAPAGTLDPSALAGPLAAPAPAGGVLAEFDRLWRKRGARSPSAGAARLVWADGDPAALRHALAAWVVDHWHTPLAELAAGGGKRSLEELYSLPPRFYLPG